LGRAQELGSALRVVGEALQTASERYERADERLLGAVVEIALDPPPGVTPPP
jgi:hypothetical protein